PLGSRPRWQRKTNLRPSLSHWRGRAHLRAISRTGSGAYPRAPANKTEVAREDFSSPFGSFPHNPKNQNRKISEQKYPRLLFSNYYCLPLKNLESRPRVLANHVALQLGGCVAHFVRGRLLTAPRSHRGDAPKQRL